MLIQYKSATQQAMLKESAARFKKIKSHKINLCIVGNTYYFRTHIKECLTYFLKPLNFYLTWQLKSDFKDTEAKRGLSIL